MATKLTLTIQEEVIEAAKKYAREKEKSISDIVENYLKSITSQHEGVAVLSPKVTKLMGAIKIPDDFDYKNELGIELEKKYR